MLQRVNGKWLGTNIYTFIHTECMNACIFCTWARAGRYNIAASWTILYCLTPGPRVSPHQLFSFERERAIQLNDRWNKSFVFSTKKKKKYTYTSQTLSLILTLSSSFDLSLSCSILLFLAFLFKTKMTNVTLKKKKT